MNFNALDDSIRACIKAGLPIYKFHCSIEDLPSVDRFLREVWGKYPVWFTRDYTNDMWQIEIVLQETEKDEQMRKELDQEVEQIKTNELPPITTTTVPLPYVPSTTAPSVTIRSEEKPGQEPPCEDSIYDEDHPTLSELLDLLEENIREHDAIVNAILAYENQ